LRLLYFLPHTSLSAFGDGFGDKHNQEKPNVVYLHTTSCSYKQHLTYIPNISFLGITRLEAPQNATEAPLFYSEANHLSALFFFPLRASCEGFTHLPCLLKAHHPGGGGLRRAREFPRSAFSHQKPLFLLKNEVAPKDRLLGIIGRRLLPLYTKPIKQSIYLFIYLYQHKKTANQRHHSPSGGRFVF
jgi:hypothetical protein